MSQAHALDRLTERFVRRYSYERRGAVALLLPLSMLLHGVFLAALPVLGVLRPFTGEFIPFERRVPRIEVEFRKPKPPEPPVEAGAQEARPVPPKQPGKADWQLPRSFHHLAPPPPIDLPQAKVDLPALPPVEVALPDLPLFDALPQVEFDANPLPRGDLHAIAPPDVYLGPDQSMPAVGSNLDALPPDPNREGPALPLGQKLPDNLTLQGPVAQRAMYPPALPQPERVVTVTIRLKFWVRPDGSVGQVTVLRKGSAELEQLAMDYMRKWRFAPLPPGSAQSDEWGEITIRFEARP